nr:hypothetical protein [Pantoea dispersa]
MYKRQDLNGVRAEARQGSLLREGMKVVIAGRPNACLLYTSRCV